MTTSKHRSLSPWCGGTHPHDVSCRSYSLFMRRAIIDRTAPNELCLDPITELDPPHDGVIIPETKPDGISYLSPPGVTAPELMPEGKYGVIAPLLAPLAVSLS